MAGGERKGGGGAGEETETPEEAGGGRGKRGEKGPGWDDERLSWFSHKLPQAPLLTVFLSQNGKT